MSDEEGTGGEEGLPIFSEQLPSEVRDDPNSQVLLKELKDVPHLFQCYKELKVSSEGMVKLPTEKSSAEELQGFFTKLGKPEKPGDYDVKPIEAEGEIEGSQEFVDAFRNKAFALNLSKGQTEQLYSWFIEGVRQNSDLQVKAFKEANEAAHKKLRDVWGADYPKKMENAKKVILKYAPDGLKEELAKSDFKNSPELLVLLARIGDAIGEDVLISGGVTTGPVTEEEKEQVRLKAKYPSMYE